jgi:hypothetical protein
MTPRAPVAALVTALLLLGAPFVVGAQVVPVKPDSARRDSLPTGARAQGADTTRRAGARAPGDTLPAQRVILWDTPDSVMTELLQRTGYAVTRYQGSLVVFRARDNVMVLRGAPSQVSRDEATLVGDTIQYNDSTQRIVALGDTLLLRDPTRSDDIIGTRLLRYDVVTREGLVYGVTTAVESGQRWIVHGGAAAFKGDTAGGGSTAFYARHGWLTSCQEKEPHYHFAASEIKMISKNVLVARPAILYIADIPVFWLPFIFQDIRTGRRSGIIPPRFGFTEIVRNSPAYRRTIEDFGYYFALSDYLDSEITMDWRSDARPTESDPGWLKFNGRMRYRWRDRFIGGELGASYHYLKDGTTNQQYSLNHQQEFSQRTRLTANLNYVTNTVVQRNTTFNPFSAMQTISSQLNFSTARGPFQLALGGSQRQYPGRDQIDRDFPSVSLTSRPIEVGEWFTWTPSLSLSNSQSQHIDQIGDFAYRFMQRPDGGVDSVRVDRNNRSSSIRFDTPIQVFGFNWRNSFSVTDRLNDFPERRTIVDVNDTTRREVRVYKRTYVTDVNWETGFNLPGFSQGKWNISPSVQIQKVDGRSGLLVRTERTGNRFVSQSVRPAFGLGVAPTLYHIYGGIGPVVAIRHSISPTLSYQYTPRGSVSDEFLAANGDTRVGYLGANQQNIVTLGLNTTIEAKLRPASDTVPPEQGEKLKLLSVGFSTLSYDFERARVTGKTGLTNRNFGITARSDLLPGFDFGADWSLFQGDPVSDTASFQPYRESLRATLSLGAGSPLVRGIGRLLGFQMDAPAPGAAGGAPPAGPPPGTSAVGAAPPFVAGQPIAGSINRLAGMTAPAGRGWQWNLTYSSQRQRPPRGENVTVLDPLADCQQFRTTNPVTYEICVAQRSQTSTETGPGTQTTRGGTYFVTPAQSNAQSTLSFHVTEKWGALWSTTYDFEQREFASQMVTLTREMHDWDAVFSFLRAPNGNFAFNFHIALKAQPDIKFDFDRRAYPRGYTGVRR